MNTNRRCFLLGAGAVLFAPLDAKAVSLITVYKDPSCGCCGGWVEHIAGAGFPTKIIEESKINIVKGRLGVPSALWSCHTAEIENYILEGHVPAIAVIRLLEDRPSVRGLAVAGMPVGSPGMEVEGRVPEQYDVMSFGLEAPSVFMRFRGAIPIPS